MIRILLSLAYLKDKKRMAKEILRFVERKQGLDLMLDCGAFTRFKNRKTVIDLNSYKDFISCFKEFRPVVISLDWPPNSSTLLENPRLLKEEFPELTILPVLQPFLRKEEIFSLMRDFPYLAIGTFGLKSNYIFSKSRFEFFKYIISVSRRYSVAIHGLAYVRAKFFFLRNYFSADSSCFSFSVRNRRLLVGGDEGLSISFSSFDSLSERRRLALRFNARPPSFPSYLKYFKTLAPRERYSTTRDGAIPLAQALHFFQELESLLPRKTLRIETLKVKEGPKIYHAFTSTHLKILPEALELL